MIGWRNWQGGERAPVEPNTVVEVVLRDGKHSVLPASVLDWVHDLNFPESDIVQFKEVEDPHVRRSPLY